MEFDQINKEISIEDINLKPFSSNDRDFVSSMFNDSGIKKYYIVPKEAQQDYRRLIDYWLNDNKNGAGTCWIISQKSNGLFAKDKPCGFIAFEFRDSIRNARISYSILPEYRKRGFASKAVKTVIERLKQHGVVSVEADIDSDNVASEKVVEKLGFTTNKREGLIDPEMMRDGEIRIRFLWKKQLAKETDSQNNERIPLIYSINQIAPIINQLVEQINSIGQSPEFMLRYFYLLGRIKYLEGNFDEAQEAFGQCNMIAMNGELQELHEVYFWFAKINEAKGEHGTAKMYYGFALEKYHDNPNYITKAEIEQAMNN